MLTDFLYKSLGENVAIRLQIWWTYHREKYLCTHEYDQVYPYANETSQLVPLKNL